MANPQLAMATPLDFTLYEGEQLAVVGPNASGKTRFVDILAGRVPLRGDAIRYDFSGSGKKYVSDNIKYIAFRDSYGSADGSYYLQQRWNQQEMDVLTPLVKDSLDSLRTDPEASSLVDRYVGMFRMDSLLDKYVVTLSSGELRKLQLVKVLSQGPSLLVIDNPFLGLDAATRLQLSDLLGELAAAGLQMVLVLSRLSDIPSFITHVQPVRDMTLGEKYEWKPEPGPEDVLRLTDVSIRYGERTILKNLSWRVRKGEHWIVTGENGSGKSTLLSIICADNPQAYACNVELFGRRRGTGESIWDIKRNIGYVSPEMHRACQKDVSALDIVAGGFFDTVGLYSHPSEAQKAEALAWMQEFGVGDIADRGYLHLSGGEQRLCLLARAFVKNPPLLILDEPMHGLDDETKEKVRGFLDHYFKTYPEKTLLMVTHYLDEMPECIDHHLVLPKNV